MSILLPKQDEREQWKQVELVRDQNISGELYLPAYCPISGGCYPGIVIIPDDSGIADGRERAYASYFAARGMTCFIIDPFSTKGLQDCTSDLRTISTREMIQMACRAYVLLVQRRSVKKLGVLGIGRGGLAAIHLGMEHVPGLGHCSARFAFLVALCPAAYIQLRSPRPTGAPLLLITAGRDDMANSSAAVRYAARIKAACPTMTVQTQSMVSLCHAWENEGKPRYSAEAVSYPKDIYYLEENGTYTVDKDTKDLMPSEVVRLMAKKAKRGCHVGGGDSQRFLAVCRSIGTFIFKNHLALAMDVDLGVLNSLQMRDDLLLAMAQSEDLDKLFTLVTTTFGNLPDTALVRIWLVEPPDGACTGCTFNERCNDHKRCLHLVASAGYSIANEQEWHSTHGNFQHFPFGVHKVGVIAATGTAFHVHNVRPDMDWVADPDWIRQEKVRTLLGLPLISENNVIGVFMLFSRGDHDKSVLNSLRIVTEHMAVRIAHARAFEELGRLKRQLEIENSYLQINRADNSLSEFVGESAAIRHVKEQILQVAPTDAVVFITGESGTGKELVANELHANSRVAEGPLVKVNCSNIPQELFESEFFGYVRGAFTGADSNHMGFFEAAEHGTLFLDEIGELPMSQQSKFLRVLQEREYRRVGEQVVHKFHTRVIAATNRNPSDMVRLGTMREDLFYRLNVFPIHLPSLRERREDIPLLVRYFLDKFSRLLNRPGLILKEGEMERLLNYPWPGNIRELQNVLHRGAILAQGKSVSLDFLDPGLIRAPALQAPSETMPSSSRFMPFDGRILDCFELRAFERENMMRALHKCNGKIFGQHGAAALLKIKPTTLIARLEKLGIDRKRFGPDLGVDTEFEKK